MTAMDDDANRLFLGVNRDSGLKRETAMDGTPSGFDLEKEEDFGLTQGSTR
jgi:hypothetical protein